MVQEVDLEGQLLSLVDLRVHPEDFRCLDCSQMHPEELDPEDLRCDSENWVDLPLWVRPQQRIDSDRYNQTYQTGLVSFMSE